MSSKDLSLAPRHLRVVNAEDAERDVARPEATRRRAIFGRAAELARLLDVLDAGARLVSVIGPPGIGKSELVQQARAAVEARFSGALVVCDLAAERDDALLESAIDRALARLAPSPDGARASLGAARPSTAELLAARGPTCVVLDNFEQLASAAPLLVRLLAQHEGLAFIVTSRERLACEGEVVVELAPLTPADAALLFRTRASDAGSDIRAADDATIGELVARLDCIPLAIELAAARTRLFTPRQLADRLATNDAFVLGVESRRGRHRTLEAAIRWSWDLLSPAERLALAVCSRFATDFDVDVAAAVLVAVAAELPPSELDPAQRPRDESEAIALFAALRDKSLLRADAASGRLSLFRSVRAFTGVALTDKSVTLARLDAALLDRFSLTADALVDARLLQTTEPRPEVLGAIRAERDNLVTLVERAALLPHVAPSWVVTVCALALLYELPSERAERYLRRCLETPASEGPPLGPRLTTIATLALATTLSATGRHAEADEIGRPVRDGADVPLGLRAYALATSGIQWRAQGQLSLAEDAHARAAEVLDLPEGKRLVRLLAMNTACLGRLACDLAEFETARERNRKATALSDSIGDEWLAALGLANLAQLEQEARRYDEAERLLSDALGRFERTHERTYEAIYACRRGGLHLEAGRLDLARVDYERALALLARLNMPQQSAMAEAGLALVALAQSSTAEASQRSARARTEARRGMFRTMRWTVDLLLGALELSLPNRSSDAVASWRRTRDALVTGDDVDAIATRTNLDARFALRMLERALSLADPSFEPHAAPEGNARSEPQPRFAPPTPAPLDGTLGARELELGPDALWFSVDRAARVDLSRRGSLRRILAALARSQREAPSVTLDVHDLTRAGWPGERILPEAAATRVRVAIATLRKLGLRDVVLTRDDGYWIEPRTRTTHVADTEPGC
ncbi:MAG: AAA family ATPase [Polyangiaceae bacterium]